MATIAVNAVTYVGIGELAMGAERKNRSRPGEAMGRPGMGVGSLGTVKDVGRTAITL